MDSFWNLLVNHLKEKHVDYTYFGIGSAPRKTILKEFTAELDQIIPVFVMDIIKNTSKTIRIINMDPEFNKCIEFLHEYFASKNMDFEYDNTYEGKSMHIWKSKDDRIEVIIISEYLDNDRKLFGITNLAINTNTILVVQRYTGNDLIDIFKQIYNELSDRGEEKRKYIRERVLFDITYGEDCHCTTNMVNYKPIYDMNGNFHNILLYTPEELLEYRDNPKIYNFAKKHYLNEYKKILGELQPEYRRKMQNIPLHGYKDKYDINNITAEKIMDILENEVENILIIFGILNMINDETQAKLSDLFMNYKQIDMYEWYTIAVNLFK